jgi:DNA-directed RNA polymerase specialized sigma24 family protein
MVPQNDGDSFESSSFVHFRRLLDKLSAPERDALFRFYCLNETPEQIHRETGISGPELRALRSRTREEFRTLRKRSQPPS